MITHHNERLRQKATGPFLFTYPLLGLFSVYHRILENHVFLRVVSWHPNGDCFVAK
ncbi:hypothetical protein SCLCIDRAFT_1224061, partial [Scleroderma citrinum Foug A]